MRETYRRHTNRDSERAREETQIKIQKKKERKRKNREREESDEDNEKSPVLKIEEPHHAHKVNKFPVIQKG